MNSPGEVKHSKDKIQSHDEYREYRDAFVEEDLSLIEVEPDISWNNNKLFSHMLKMIKKTGCYLKSARIYSCSINGGGYGSVHSMINHITVKTLTSLEHIDLTFSLFYRQPEDLFSKLKNLRKMILNIEVDNNRRRGSNVEDISEDEICLKIETIIKKNPSLQEFYVKKLKLGSLERIKHLK